jgi:hypothetical protein
MDNKENFNPEEMAKIIKKISYQVYHYVVKLLTNEDCKLQTTPEMLCTLAGDLLLKSFIANNFDKEDRKLIYKMLEDSIVDFEKNRKLH